MLVTEGKLLEVALEACKEVGIGEDRVLVLSDSASGESWREEKEKAAEGKKGGKGEKEKGACSVESVLDGVVKGERVELDPERDLAFLVYSSGTTGLVSVPLPLDTTCRMCFKLHMNLNN